MRRAASAAAMSGDDAKLESPPPGESDPLVSDASGKRQITRRSQWYHTAFVVMAEVMGAGILGLPYATSRLGLGLGLGMSSGTQGLGSAIGDTASTFIQLILVMVEVIRLILAP